MNLFKECIVCYLLHLFLEGHFIKILFWVGSATAAAIWGDRCHKI